MKSRTKAKPTRNIQVVKLSRSRIKKLLPLALIGLFVLFFFGMTYFATYSSKLSDRDFAQIESSAEKILTSIGAEKIDKFKYCSNDAPGKYDEKRLYCSIQMASYLEFLSNEQAIEVVKKLEQEIGKAGQISSYFNKFFEKPNNTLADATIHDAKAFKNRQCRFTVASHEAAKDVAHFLPRQERDNLIAIVFDCDGESREEYFPVLYR